MHTVCVHLDAFVSGFGAAEFDVQYDVLKSPSNVL
jgi:hypothetical protein